eukprot:3228560-Amphidinium_carterae.3
MKTNIMNIVNIMSTSCVSSTLLSKCRPFLGNGVGQEPIDWTYFPEWGLQVKAFSAGYAAIIIIIVVVIIVVVVP